jgi:transcriptional regulator with XRE-family HTH domain
MKLKIGSRLQAIREERKINQDEMAELLSMSSSSYGRLERGDSSIPFEELNRISKVLSVPIQDLLPEIFSIYNNNNTNQSGLIFGDIYNFYNSNEVIERLKGTIEKLNADLENLKSKFKDKGF